MRRISLIFLILALAALSAITGSAARKMDDAPFWTGKPDVATFTKMQDERLAKAQQVLNQVLAVKGKRTVANTLKPYDEVLIYLDAAGSQSGLIQEVHPDEAMRSAAEKQSQKVQAFYTDLSLNRAVYDALVSLDLQGVDAETRFYVEKTLRDFRLAGVDKDEATRKRIKELRDELVLIGQEFARNIRDDKRTVIANSAAELEGLPADYIARHKPAPDGKITLTIDYPDSLPVFSYAKHEGLRKRMYMEYNNRAFPMNMSVLDRMVAKRHELANLLGFSNWADYITADKMVESGKNASAFIDRIVEASRTKAAGEYQTLLKRKQQDVPGAKGINAWESTYYSELVRKASYDFDSQSVRPYFPYDKVKQGVFDVTSKLFGVTYRQIKDAPVYDPSVEAYEMLEDGKLVGRFYLDMHPRKGKYNHAAEFAVRAGVKGQQIPEAVLVCNFPGGEANDPGLMEHDDVQTFFHEFGHLLHELFAGRHAWVGLAGTRTEQDFVEAPSQMLEEWTWDPATLQTFARHYQTNQPIPTELVKQMKRASEFGKGLTVRRQMVYAKLSLSIYDRKPSEVDTNAMIKGLTEQYQPYPFVEDTHWQASFGHLDGYSAVYYTYMWSLVIAKDMFSQFDKSNLLAPGIAKRYRDAVLTPGGSKPASKLVETFLNRPFNFKAWQEWLNEGS
ncbi:MAG: thimet oligopeptidase [Acidobacteriota bacterium]|jgi:thimet oligopeptidase|nr:thimet oligopeptidase [Acidobacteriota bacterium]